jgi:hypothetical protein
MYTNFGPHASSPSLRKARAAEGGGRPSTGHPRAAGTGPDGAGPERAGSRCAPRNGRDPLRKEAAPRPRLAPGDGAQRRRAGASRRDDWPATSCRTCRRHGSGPTKYDLRLHRSASSSGYDELIQRGSPVDNRFSLFYFRESEPSERPPSTVLATSPQRAGS